MDPGNGNVGGGYGAWPAMFGQPPSGQSQASSTQNNPAPGSNPPMPGNFNYGALAGYPPPTAMQDGHVASQPGPSQSPTSQYANGFPQAQPPQQMAMPGYPQNPFPQPTAAFPSGNIGGAPGSVGGGGGGFGMPVGAPGAGSLPGNIPGAQGGNGGGGFGMQGGAPGAGPMPGMGPGGYPQGMGPGGFPPGMDAAQRMQNMQNMQQMYMMMQMQMNPMAAAMSMQQPTALPHTQSVHASAEDDREIARLLAGAKEVGRTYKQVLEDFANTKRQSPAAWKDYYLTHLPRLNGLAAKLSNNNSVPTTKEESKEAALKKLPAAKKPVFDITSSPEPEPRRRPSARAMKAVKSEPIEVSLSSASHTGRTRSSNASQATSVSAGANATTDAVWPKPKVTLPSFRRRADAEPSAKRQRTASSTGAPPASVSSTSSRAPARRPAVTMIGRQLAGYASTSRGSPFATVPGLPLLQTGVSIPPVPSRSPTPPTRVVPQAGRTNVNAYTDEDRAFFVRFIRYELARDPELTRADLCRMLAEKVPHHTEQSWSNHWQTRHDVADNILRLAEDSRVSHSPAVRSSRAARPPTTPLASSSLPSSDDEGEKERVALPAKYESPSETEDSGDDSGADDDLDAYDPEMGGSGAKMTEGDLHALAKHVASMSAGQWKRSATSRRWDRFSEIHSKRTFGAWQSHYKRNKQDVQELAHKYRQRERRQRVLQAKPVATRNGDVPMDEDAEGETDAETDEHGSALKNGWPGMNAKASLKQRARKTRVPGEKDGEDDPDSSVSPIVPISESLDPTPPPPQQQRQQQSPPVLEDPLLTMAKKALGQNGVYVHGTNGMNGANGTNGTNGTNIKNGTNGVNNSAPALYTPPVGHPATEMQQLRAMLGQR